MHPTRNLILQCFALVQLLNVAACLCPCTGSQSVPFTKWRCLAKNSLKMTKLNAVDNQESLGSIESEGREGSSWNSDDSLKIPKSYLPKNMKLEIPHEMGTGTLAWGDSDRGFLSDSKKKPKSGEYTIKNLYSSFHRMIESDLVFFDTAETYGSINIKKKMSSEMLLGRFLQEYDGDKNILIGAKYTPVLWPGVDINGFVPSLDRMELAYVDLYSLHYPKWYIGGYKALAEGLARCKERGLCKHVGVCNMNGEQIKKFKGELDRLKVPLVAAQVEFSLANQRAVDDGTVSLCKRMGLIIFAHTPLGRGIATGANTALDPTGGKPGVPRYSFKDLEPLLPVHEALGVVAAMVSSRLSSDEDSPVKRVSTTQVSLNYIRAKGLIPIPGVTNKEQADEVAGCLGWRLNGEEVELLDTAYRKYVKNVGGNLVKRDFPVAV